MNKAIGRSTEHARYQCCIVKNDQSKTSPQEEIYAGLVATPSWIACKYFYDEKGSTLFDQICDVPEYYPTRTEAALLQESASEIIAFTKPDNIIELGSGTARKTRYLLHECQRQAIHPDYWPFDVCEPVIYDTAMQLIDEYSWLSINGLLGDYMAGLQHFPNIPGRNCYIYIGGTIGNFDHDQAVAFLSELKTVMNSSDYLLLGLDRVKDIDVLTAAYNDKQGLTAEFNLNVLDVINGYLDSDFDRNGFKHEAFYNETKAQIEMHLVATQSMRVNLKQANQMITFAPGDKIFTEISRKFTEQSMQQLLSAAGFVIEKHFEADNQYFSLLLCRPNQ